MCHPLCCVIRQIKMVQLKGKKWNSCWEAMIRPRLESQWNPHQPDKESQCQDTFFPHCTYLLSVLPVSIFLLLQCILRASLFHVSVPCHLFLASVDPQWNPSVDHGSQYQVPNSEDGFQGHHQRPFLPQPLFLPPTFGLSHTELLSVTQMGYLPLSLCCSCGRKSTRAPLPWASILF